MRPSWACEAPSVAVEAELPAETHPWISGVVADMGLGVV